jgi:hypothetical protein
MSPFQQVRFYTNLLTQILVTENPISALFFASFLLIQLYFIFNLNIATVFNAYKEESENKKLSDYVRKRVAMTAAFRMLDTTKTGYIDRYAIIIIINQKVIPLQHYSCALDRYRTFLKQHKNLQRKIPITRVVSIC